MDTAVGEFFVNYEMISLIIYEMILLRTFLILAKSIIRDNARYDAVLRVIQELTHKKLIFR